MTEIKVAHRFNPVLMNTLCMNLEHLKMLKIMMSKFNTTNNEYNAPQIFEDAYNDLQRIYDTLNQCNQQNEKYGSDAMTTLYHDYMNKLIDSLSPNRMIVQSAPATSNQTTVVNSGQPSAALTDVSELTVPQLDGDPYNSNGYFNFVVKEDVDFSTEKAIAVKFKYRGQELIYFHPKSFKLMYNRLGVKKNSDTRYKIFKIDSRSDKTKHQVAELTCNEFVSLVIHSEK